MLLLLPIILFLYLNDEYWAWFVLAIAAFMVARFVFIPVFNLFYSKPRPYQKYKFKPITSRLLSWESVKPTSFPSRHIISFASFGGALLLPMPMVGVYILLLGLLTGVGRVVLGFHDFWDIFAGILIGLILGLLVFLFFGHTLPGL